MSLEGLVITEERLGTGGFSSIFIGQLGEIKVAAKRLLQSEKEFISLVWEASVLRRLQHGKHIAFTYDATFKDKNLYMVMEYSERGDLQSYLQRNKELVTYEQKILFCRGILLGLLYCHSMSVLHGNIKCSNVILGENMEPKLTDFGLSMTVDNIKDYCKAHKGSLCWTAPELFSIKKDEAVYQELITDPYPCDIYSLGATFCEISYDGTTEFIDSSKPKLDIVSRNVSPTPKNAFLKKIVAKCCQFERNKRISLDKCLSALENIAKEQLSISEINNEWQKTQQSIKENVNQHISSFILHRPAEDLVLGPSNLSLLEWLCINDFKDAVEYMIGLHNPEKRQIVWLYNISRLCKSRNVTIFLHQQIEREEHTTVKLSDLIYENPWQFIRALINAGADCKDHDLLKKAVNKHYNTVVQTIVDSGMHLNSQIIHDAVNSGNAEAVKILAIASANLDCRDENGDTPLLKAIDAQNTEIVKILLNFKANVNKENQHTSLHKASVKGNHEMVKLLIESGAIVDTESEKWKSLVQDLQQQGDNSMVQFITNTVREASVKSAVKISLLCTAIRNRCMDAAWKLISKKAHINERDYDEYVPLHWAVIFGDVDIVSDLIDAGADIDAKTPNGEQNIYPPSSPDHFNDCTPLHIAIAKRYFNVAKVLIESGANFIAEDGLGQTIVDKAVEGDRKVVRDIIQDYVSVDEEFFRWILKSLNLEIAKMLLSNRNVKVDTLNNFLCITAHSGNVDMTEYLIECKADVNSQYEDKSPLEWAISGGHAQVVQILIDQGANIHTHCKDSSDSLLHMAAAAGHKEIAKLLIDARIDIDAKDRQGNNALFRAAINGKEEVVSLLHSGGSSVRLWEKADGSDAMYETAMQIVHKAVVERKEKIVSIFAGFGIKATFGTDDYPEFLAKAIQNDREEMVRILLQKGVDLNRQNSKAAPLVAAVVKCQTEIARILIIHGADINKKDQKGRLPILEAIKMRNIDIVQLLIEYGADPKGKGRCFYNSN